jgi:hypothetical protein
VIALSLFAFVITGVIMATTRAYSYVQSNKMQVIAMNLAREGVEMIYNIRDTNWKRHSGEKDKYWLLADPFNINGLNTLIVPGYAILDIYSQNGQQYPVLNGQGDITNWYEDLKDHIGDAGVDTYQVLFSGTMQD